MNKVVYFAGAVRGDRSLGNNLKKIIVYIKSLGYTVLTEHIGENDPIDTFARKIGKTKEDLTAEDIEQQDISWLNESTHVIAEISGASTGTGREIEYARTKGRLGHPSAKVLCIYQKDREYYASPMVRGMNNKKYPNIFVASYKDIDDAMRLVKSFLEN